MVENTQAKTKTDNGVCFYDGDRLLEAEVMVKQSKKPENTFTQILKYFGQKDVHNKELNDHVERHYGQKEAENFKFDGYDTILFKLKNFVLNNLPENEDYDAKDRVSKEGTHL